MILFFKAGWGRWFLGVCFLAGLLLLLHHLHAVSTSPLEFLKSPDSNPARVAVWAILGVCFDLGGLFAFLAASTILLSRKFPRWFLGESVRLFGRHNSLLAAAAALMTFLLEEPLFRLYLQPGLGDELGFREGILAAAAVFAAFHWSPFTTVWTIWAFPRFLLLTYAMERGGSPLVPMVAHAVSDFVLILLISRLGRLGLTWVRPDVPEPIADRSAWT